MNFFKQLEGLLPEGRPFTINIIKKGAELTLSLVVSPSNEDDDKESLIKALKPLNVIGNATELDEKFFEVIQAPQEKILTALTTNAAEVEKSVEAAVEDNKPKAKPAPKEAKKTKAMEKKEADDKKAKDFKMHVEAGDGFIEKKEWASAVINFEEAIKLVPGDKKVKEKLQLSRQWVKSLKSAGMFEEAEPEVAEIAKASPNVEIVTPTPDVEEPEFEEEVSTEDDDDMDIPIDL